MNPEGRPLSPASCRITRKIKIRIATFGKDEGPSYGWSLFTPSGHEGRRPAGTPEMAGDTSSSAWLRLCEWLPLFPSTVSIAKAIEKDKSVCGATPNQHQATPGAGPCPMRTSELVFSPRVAPLLSPGFDPYPVPGAHLATYATVMITIQVISTFTYPPRPQ